MFIYFFFLTTKLNLFYIFLNLCLLPLSLPLSTFVFTSSLLPSAPPTITQEGDLQTDEGNPSQVHAALHSTGQQAQKLFGIVKGGAGNLFKKLKDSSSTVVHQVAKSVRFTCVFYRCNFTYLSLSLSLSLSLANLQSPISKQCNTRT